MASDPSPATGAGDVYRDGSLSWASGLFASTHDLYFGTDANAVDQASRDNPMDVLVAQGLSDNTYDPGRLEFDQTYYWRVDEVNGAPDFTVFRGAVWSLTVESLGVVFPAACGEELN